jgi:hypothetical protein
MADRPIPARPRVSEVLLPWLGAGAAGGLAFGSLLTRRHAGLGIDVLGVAGFVGVSSLFFMGLGAFAGLTAWGFACALPRLRAERTHVRVAVAGMAGFAVSLGSREFGFDGATTALLTLAAVLAADAAGRALVDRGFAGVAFALLTIHGTASVAALGVMSLTIPGSPERGALAVPSVVRRDPIRPPLPRAMHGGRVLWIALDDPWGLAELPSTVLADLPHAAAVLRDGMGGSLDCLDLTGAAAWTTAATGRLPAVHGIVGETFLAAGFLPHTPLDIRAGTIAGFLATLRLTTRSAYTSIQRRTKAIWNMASDTRLTSRIVAFPVTHPAERLRGEVLSPLAVDVDGALDGTRAGYAEPAELLAAARALAATIDGGAPAGWIARNRLVMGLALRRDAPSSEKNDLTIAHLTFPGGDPPLRAGALAQLDALLADATASLGPLDTLVVTGVPSSARAGSPGFLRLLGSDVKRDGTRPVAADLLDVCPLLLHFLGLPMAADLSYDHVLVIAGLTLIDDRSFADIGRQFRGRTFRDEARIPRVIPTWEVPSEGRLDASASTIGR